jgi:hypothetical protein
MAKFSEKVKGKEIGQADVYAKPHTMSGKNVDAKVPVKTGAAALNEMNPSVAGLSKGNYKAEKTDGIKIRGTGAATKGLMARGPMA